MLETKTGSFFHFLNEVVNIIVYEKTVEKNFVECFDKISNFFATTGANLAKKFSSLKVTQREKHINFLLLGKLISKKLLQLLLRLRKSIAQIILL